MSDSGPAAGSWVVFGDANTLEALTIPVDPDEVNALRSTWDAHPFEVPLVVLEPAR